MRVVNRSIRTRPYVGQENWKDERRKGIDEKGTGSMSLSTVTKPIYRVNRIPLPGWDMGNDGDAAHQLTKAQKMPSNTVWRWRYHCSSL